MIKQIFPILTYYLGLVLGYHWGKKKNEKSKNNNSL